jgi:hypothetical protein
MIRVINGLRYNTETATRVFFHTNGAYANDFSYRSKSLFLTPKGAWFIRHWGGPMTDMATRVGNNGRGWGEEIEAVCEDDAYGFLEAHSDDSEAMEAIEKYFPDRVVDA